jgi:hypothetical protein
LPPSSPQQSDVKRSLQLIKPRVEEAQKKETTEMLDKLKGLSNSFLSMDKQLFGRRLTLTAGIASGNFGLSTDNFKVEPNEQGSYSMKFVR